MVSISVLFGTFFLMIIIGTPIGIALGVSALIVGFVENITPIVMVQQMLAQLDSFTLLAIPFFLLVGQIMEKGHVTERLVQFSNVLVGHITGGLGHVNIVSEMVLSGISGSATADAAALGSVMIPAMQREGYPPEMAAAINAASATNGPIIPPSIFMVVYGAYGSVSIAALFIGGFVPGIILGVFLMGVVYMYCKTHNLKAREKRATMKEVKVALIDAFFALLVPFIIIGGILSGIFTATESGMIATIYCLILVGFGYKSVNIKQLIGIFKQALEGSAQALLCVAGAGAFSYMMAYLRIPQIVLELAGPIAGNYGMTMLFICVLFLILGTFMDGIPAIVIFLPIVQQLAAAANINQIYMGLMVTILLCMGLLTPPYGMTLLMSSAIARVDSMKVVKSLKWFYVVFIGMIILFAVFPEILLFVPRLLVPASFT